MTLSRLTQIVLAAWLLCVGSTAALAQAMSHAEAAREFEKLKSRLAELEKPLLAVAPDDQAKFADFLREADTGLIRLLPREKYDGRLEIRGGGAYYSFVRKTHEYGYGSDIQLSQNEFGVGFAGMDFGYLLKLGDVPLELLTAEHPAVAALQAYQPKRTEAEIRAENRHAYQGVPFGGFTGKRRVPANVDTTYLLRSVCIDNSDVLVALRTLRLDSDASMILLWKILHHFPKPTAVREER